MAVEPAIARIRQRIGEVYIHQGEPSTRVISVGLGRAISHSTVSKVLRCTKLPSWGHLELVAEYLDGNVEEFRALWVRARNELRLPDGQFEIAEIPQPRDGSPSAAEATYMGDLIDGYVQDLIDRQAAVGLGIATGFVDLDTLLSPGLRPGQLIVVTARPATGKTTFLINLARHASIRQGVTTAFFTLEQSAKDVMQRVIAAEARIPIHILESGQLLEGDWDKLTRRVGEIRSAPLAVAHVRDSSLANLKVEIKRVVDQDKVSLVAVDGVRQIRLDDGASDAASICRALKQLAVELGIVILTTVPTHEPTRSLDLGEVVGLVAPIAEDADVVILINRDDQYDYYNPRAGEADLFVAKNRNGPTDVIIAAAQLHLARFVDMAIAPEADGLTGKSSQGDSTGGI